MSERIAGRFLITDDPGERDRRQPGSAPFAVTYAVRRALEQLYEAAHEHGAPLGYGEVERWQLTLTTGHFNTSLGPHSLLEMESQVRERRLPVSAEAMEQEIMRLLSTPRHDAPADAATDTEYED